jgi:DNA/RNA-binding domain of Phe-tRNA-synthetase-like protein
LKLEASAAFFALFPEARIGVVIAREIDNHTSPEESAELEKRLARAAAAAAELLGETSLTEHPRIRCWREAYRSFGAKPKKYPSSIENLGRRALRGEPPRHINKLVDLYNVVSLTHVLPAGGEDLDRIRGDVELTRASDAEPAIRLLGEKEERAPKSGEVIYRDGVGAICRRWNWKEAERTKLTDETRKALLIIESLPPIDRATLERALDDLATSVSSRTGATTAVHILENESRCMEFAP